jgi:hypothetical protein
VTVWVSHLFPDITLVTRINHMTARQLLAWWVERVIKNMTAAGWAEMLLAWRHTAVGHCGVGSGDCLGLPPLPGHQLLAWWVERVIKNTTAAGWANTTPAAADHRQGAIDRAGVPRDNPEFDVVRTCRPLLREAAASCTFPVCSSTPSTTPSGEWRLGVLCEFGPVLTGCSSATTSHSGLTHRCCPPFASWRIHSLTGLGFLPSFSRTTFPL